MSAHLGDQTAAFVDGQLDFAHRERALEHLDRCAQCREAVQEQRRLKARVQTLPGAEPSADLLSALTSVPAQAPAQAPVAPPPGRSTARARPGLLRRGGLVAAGAGSVVGGLLGLAYALGGSGAAAEQPPVSPPVGQFSAEFAGSEQPLPFADPAMDAFPVVADPAAPPGEEGGR